MRYLPRTLLYAGGALLVTALASLLLVYLRLPGQVVILVMWTLAFSACLQELQRVTGKDRRELDTWLQVGGDLLLTCPTRSQDLDQPISGVGPGFSRVLGWSEDELIGKPWNHLVHPDDQSAALMGEQRVATDKIAFQFVNRWRHKYDLDTGEPRWVWLEWSAVADETLGLLYANARDMTGRFEREAQMATWSRITSDLMAVADTAVPVTERTFEWVNEAWSRQLGWDLNELYEMQIVELLEPGEATAVINHRIHQEALGTTPEPVIECRVKRKPRPGHPPEYRYYEWSSLTLNGKLYVTGRNIGQERIHRERMAKAIADLEASNQDLERFASVAAHQLRSPPRTIAGMAQALTEDYGHLLDGEGLQFLEDIRNDADQMAETVDGLYRFSKVRTSDDLAMEPVDLNGLMQDIYEHKVKRGCFANDDQELTWDDLPTVLGDRVLLQEVLTNLIDNGFKFNQSEIRRVGVTCRPRLDHRWDIIVEDNGIGIDPKYQPKLFTMFQRVHTGYSGTGVGLALAAAIIAKLGGSIVVWSEPGAGTTFTFDLAKAWEAGLR